METVSKRVIETYKNIYLGPFLNKKEKFQETSTAAAETSTSLAPVTFTSTSTSLEPVTSTSTSLAPVTSTSTSLAPVTSAPSSTTPSPTTTSSSSEDTYYTYDPFFTLIAYIMFFFAIYLSFKCNNGFSVWGFLGAFLFSPIYIIYKLTSTPKMCNLIK